MTNVARLIITMNCNRNCDGCCNKDAELMNQGYNLDQFAYPFELLKPYPVVCITGGEPMLEVDRTIRIIKELKKHNPDVVVYLYTALWNLWLIDVMPLVDGIQFSIHYPASANDIKGLEFMENLICGYEDKSCRLYIDNRVNNICLIQPSLWTRIKIDKWKDKCPLPENEILFFMLD